MILFRRGIWQEQELTAYKIGTIIERNDRHIYSLRFKALSKKDSRIGVKLWWKPISGIDFGHFALISSFDTRTKNVELCDPLHSNKSFHKVKLGLLEEGMLPRWDGVERGFAVIKKK